MNVELLEQVKARILAEPEHFRMDTWSCGTAHCIGGWAIALKGLVVVNPRAVHGCYQDVVVYGETLSAMSVATELLDLDNAADGITEAERLFITEYWPGVFEAAYRNAETREERAQIAAERIDLFVASNGAE